jgi:hypothetical protein
MGETREIGDGRGHRGAGRGPSEACRGYAGTADRSFLVWEGAENADHFRGLEMSRRRACREGSCQRDGPR